MSDKIIKQIENILFVKSGNDLPVVLGLWDFNHVVNQIDDLITEEVSAYKSEITALKTALRLAIELLNDSKAINLSVDYIDKVDAFGKLKEQIDLEEQK